MPVALQVSRVISKEAGMSAAASGVLQPKPDRRPAVRSVAFDFPLAGSSVSCFSDGSRVPKGPAGPACLAVWCRYMLDLDFFLLVARELFALQVPFMVISLSRRHKC